MWGWSPGDGHFGTGTFEYLRWARQRGTRIVCVDPRRTRTSRALADEHVFIRPSTDAAALIAMTQVIVAEGLQDQAFLDRLVLGFDEAHLPARGAPRAPRTARTSMGEADGVPKTPEWAAPITGVPAATLRRLAIEFATRPARGDPLRLRAGADGVRGAVPPRGVRPRGGHRQRRRVRRQLRL